MFWNKKKTKQKQNQIKKTKKTSHSNEDRKSEEVIVKTQRELNRFIFILISIEILMGSTFCIYKLNRVSIYYFISNARVIFNRYITAYTN